MAANNLTIEQSYAFLQSLYEEASGEQSTIQVADTASFISVATATLKFGYDTIINSISQVLGRTIFSIRPYTAKFRGIDVDEMKWGSIVRKINFVDGDLEQDDRYGLTDGQSVDQYIVRKPKILQTNFYGATTYQRHITIFKDQLDVAFQSAAEFGRFISGILQNVEDQLEQVREAEARACLANFIGGKVAGDTANVINVLQAYKNETGTALTPATMWQQDNYVPFVKWMYAYINTLTEKLAERTVNYHINVTGKELHRHTPADRLKAYMSANVLNNIDANVLSTVFNPDRLKMIDWEKVVYWQNINDPYKISVTPSYLLPDGTIQAAASAVTVPNLIGLLFDEEALGTTRMSTWTQATPMNARGGYYNIFYHFTQRMWNDFTENGIVLIAAETT